MTFNLSASFLLCRGCLGPLDAMSEAGLCGSCWNGLVPLSENRCLRCALSHDLEMDCPEAAGWTRGDALWDYHGGRPPLGALLLPGIKHGELGWRSALLRRADLLSPPDFCSEVDIITAAPTAFHRRWIRGFDLAEDFARRLSGQTKCPFMRTLSRTWILRRQAGRTESERKRLPQKAIRVRAGTRAQVNGRIMLLVDDVWTTGTTLLRCAQALKTAGAQEVRVLTLFRAL